MRTSLSRDLMQGDKDFLDPFRNIARGPSGHQLQHRHCQPGHGWLNISAKSALNCAAARVCREHNGDTGGEWSPILTLIMNTQGIQGSLRIFANETACCFENFYKHASMV